MLAETDRIVVGYHGTSKDNSVRVTSADLFMPSQNDYDWLGHGIYFWEYAPYRAGQWAEQKYGSAAAVLKAEIRLGRCLDLTDIRYTKALRLAFDGLREAYAARRVPIPVNRGKARRLDCFVINYVAEFVFPECETIRAPFLEGDPIFEGSALLSGSHIQIVVRKPNVISNITIATPISSGAYEH